MKTWPPKDPDEYLEYGFNWSKELKGGATIASSMWFVPEGITAENDEFSPVVTKIWLSGGTLFERYELTNRVVTSRGEIMDQTARIRIKAR